MNSARNKIAALATAITAAASSVAAPIDEAIGLPAPAVDTSQSVIKFDRSQRAFFEDESRIIVVNWHRQKGKDFVAACKAVDHSIRTGQTWYIVALTQAQADETFAKCKFVVDIFKRLLRIVGDVSEESEEFLDFDREINHLFQCSSRTLKLPNGGKIVSLPGRNVDTLAGRSGNMILTEFGLFPKGGHEHWDVLFPITQRKGYKLIAISTPRGKNTKFYEVFSNPNGDYSVHLCDIVRSVFEDGYQIYDNKGNPLPQGTDEEKRAAIAVAERLYNSPSKWPREYLCQFTGDMSALIPWAQLERAADIGRELPFDHVVCSDDDVAFGQVLAELRSQIRAGVRVEVGWDVARTGNISAVMVNLAKARRPKHLRFTLGMKNCRFGLMRGAATTLMQLQAYSVGAGDATGLGYESNEELARMFPGRWTSFMFTASSKRELASSLVTAFADGMQSLPSLAEHKVIATDLYALQKDDTGSTTLIEATPNPLEPDSHCDYAMALGLASVAGARGTIVPLPVGPSRRPMGI